MCAQLRPAEGCAGRRRGQAPGRAALKARGALAARGIGGNHPGVLQLVTTSAHVAGTLWCSRRFPTVGFSLAAPCQDNRQRSPVTAGGCPPRTEQPLHGSERRAETADRGQGEAALLGLCWWAYSGEALYCPQGFTDQLNAALRKYLQYMTLVRLLQCCLIAAPMRELHPDLPPCLPRPLCR